MSMVSIVIRCCPGEVRGRRQRGGGAPPRRSESGVPTVEWGCVVRASRSTTGDVAGRAGEAEDPGGGDLAGGQRRALGMDTMAGGIRVGRGSRSCVTNTSCWLDQPRRLRAGPGSDEQAARAGARSAPGHADTGGRPPALRERRIDFAKPLERRGRSRLSVKRRLCAIALQPVERGLK